MENFREQEGRLRMGSLGKLGRFKSTAENFLVYIASISSASWPILSPGPGPLQFSMPPDKLTSLAYTTKCLFTSKLV
jgi:hypothetical protein